MAVSLEDAFAAAGVSHGARTESQKTRSGVVIDYWVETFNAGPNSPTVKAIEILVGSRDTELTDAEKAAVATLLGITAGTTPAADDTAAAVTAPGGLSKWVKAFDENGNEVDAANRDDIPRQQQFIANGFMPVEVNGILEKFQRPRGVTAAATSATATTAATATAAVVKVPLQNKDGKKIGMLTHEEGMEMFEAGDVELVPDPDNPGQTKAYKQLGWMGKRGR